MTSLLFASSFCSNQFKPHSVSVLKLFVCKIKPTLCESTEFASNDHPLMHPYSFFKIWSYFQFLFCASSYRELFGDGFHYAGCLLNAVLNQAHFSSAQNLNM